ARRTGPEGRAAGLAGGRRQASEPQRGPRGGLVRGRAGGAARRHAVLRRAGRAPAGAQRAGARGDRARHRTGGAALPEGRLARTRRRRRGARASEGAGRMNGGGLLVAGTTSDAGKSVVTAGICRWLVRQGVKVAPFKAQNMSLNSFVTREGAEIGRAQAMQAQAARVEPTALMNPVLLKPGGERSSQVVLLGRPAGEMSARGYHGGRQQRLLGTVLDCLEQLRDAYDAVICEGAGSPAEINLRRTDIVNMGIARGAGLPVLVVGDIDRGGVFASFFGTVALLSPEDQRLVAGFLVNKFRGDVSLLEPGLDMLHGLTGRRTYGVLPFRHGLGIDEEDGMGVPPLERSREWGRVSLRGA